MEMHPYPQFEMQMHPYPLMQHPMHPYSNVQHPEAYEKAGGIQAGFGGSEMFEAPSNAKSTEHTPLDFSGTKELLQSPIVTANTSSDSARKISKSHAESSRAYTTPSGLIVQLQPKKST